MGQAAGGDILMIFELTSQFQGYFPTLYMRLIQPGEGLVKAFSVIVKSSRTLLGLNL